MQLPPSGLGLNTWTQNVVANNSSLTNLLSIYNNGFTRTMMRVQSFVPRPESLVNFQGREFSNYAYIPVMQHLGQLGLLGLPASYGTINPAGVPPTMSQLTNWGGNPLAQPAIPQQQVPMMAPAVPQQVPMMAAPPPMMIPQQAPIMMAPAQPVAADMGQPMAMSAPLLMSQPLYFVAPPIVLTQ